MSHPDFHNGALPLSASAINPLIIYSEGVYLYLLSEDIKTYGKRFSNAAVNSVKAGWVEIHSSVVICFSSSLTEQLIIERINTAEVLKTRPYFLTVKEVIPEEKKLELVLIHHYMVHLEQLWMKNNQRLNTSLKIK
jgi:N-ethylmaleimide reductase